MNSKEIAGEEEINSPSFLKVYLTTIIFSLYLKSFGIFWKKHTIIKIDITVWITKECAMRLIHLIVLYADIIFNPKNIR